MGVSLFIPFRPVVSVRPVDFVSLVRGMALHDWHGKKSGPKKTRVIGSSRQTDRHSPNIEGPLGKAYHIIMQ